MDPTQQPKELPAEDTTVCGSCEISYPHNCVSLMNVNGKYYEVCAICALVHRNQMHGAPGLPFKGEQAAIMYDMAWDYIDRKQVVHPDADSEWLPQRESKDS